MKQLFPAVPRRGPVPLLAVAALVALAGCANTAPAGPALAAGAASLEAARSAGAPEYASPELNAAITKLERARTLAQNGNSAAAIQWAEQADVDAQLARARTGSERSRRALAEVETGLATLREEVNRTAISITPTPPATPAPQ